LNEPLLFTDGSILSDNNSLFIVLAEDDIDDQEFFTEAFSRLTSTIKIFIANNGNKVLQVLSNLPVGNPPLLIILDYNLPELNGADILERLNQKLLLKTVPKLVWSTSDSPFFRQRCLDNGAYAYLVKPSNLSELQSLVKTLYNMCVV
jgi:DNA-binding response OmpR family regulator